MSQEGRGLGEPTPFSLDPSEGPREALRLVRGHLPRGEVIPSRLAHPVCVRKYPDAEIVAQNS